jgi:hypothetical protein
MGLESLPEPSSQPPARWSVGGLLIESLARRDFATMGNCLDGEVRLRALLPCGEIEVSGHHDVIEWFHGLFGTAEDFELVDGTVGEIGSRLYLCWRVSLVAPDAGRRRSVVEQHMFATASERITSLDLLCSGFVTVRDHIYQAREEVPCRARW